VTVILSGQWDGTVGRGSPSPAAPYDIGELPHLAALSFRDRLIAAGKT
jgi:hypothetical protein